MDSDPEAHDDFSSAYNEVDGPEEFRDNAGIRKDPVTRERVDAIAKANEAWRLSIEGKLLKAVKWVYAGVVIAIIVSVLGVIQWKQVGDKSDQNSRSLCAYKHDLEGRVKAAQDFLKEHPEGLPGISTAAEIRMDTANRQRAVDSFRYLDC